MNIDLGLQPARKSGIPIRLPPSNICDVNPWVCRMTPANISSVQGREPAVARLTYEPFPRGCNCCAERSAHRRKDFDDDCKEPQSRRKLSTKEQQKTKKCEPKKKKSKPKRDYKALRKKEAAERCERVRLLREKKRRCDFVNACCQGLMMTPCGSVDSCASDLVQEKEQANFFIHTDCSPKVNESATSKPSHKKQRADFPCSCRTCKYVEHKTDSRTGCIETNTQEKTVCYCTDREKNETDAEEKPSGPSPCKTQPVNDCPDTENRIQDGRQPAGKVLFTAALTQEMLIRLARNGIDSANCIPTDTQYLLDCRRLPCTPAVQEPCQPCNQTAPNYDTVNSTQPDAADVTNTSCQPDAGLTVYNCNPSCRVYNCNQPMQSPPCPPVPDCNITPNCNNSVQCVKVAEINCPPDIKCNVYNCEEPQYTRIKCTTMPDCTQIYDLDSQPDVTYCLNDYGQPCSPRPQFQQTACEQRMWQQPISSSQFNCNLATAIQQCLNPRKCPCPQGSYQNNSSSRDTKACGHICIPKEAVPDSAGDMSSSKFWVPLTFYPRKESSNSARYPCMDRPRRRRPAPQDTMSSIQENTQMYSSSRRTSEPRMMPSRLSRERTSYTRNSIRSSETHTTKPSSPNISPRNSSGYYGANGEGAIEPPPTSLRKSVKKQNTVKPFNRNNQPENKRREDVRKMSKQSETRQKQRERLSRSRSPSPLKAAKSGVVNKTKTEAKKRSSKETPGHKPSSPPHFDDIEPSHKASSAPRNEYEADLIKAMEKVRRRHIEQNNYDAALSSDPKSQGTTPTEPCLTPTYQEFICLTEQIKCLRRDLKKYISGER